MINAYHDNKYVDMLKSYKKYYQIAFFGFLGLSLYLFIRKHPNDSRSMMKHANGIIRYMPIDRTSADLLTPLLDFGSRTLEDSREISPQQKRMMNSGACQTGGQVKRSVSETKKKFVAANQGWKCGNMSCQKQLPAWYEVDHKTRLDQGGTNEVSNLMALCPDCHRKKTTLENL